MSYLAIARKYRPATFDEIVGQEHVTATLRNAIAAGRIHHAFLFCGPRGVGKTTAARALARSLNCVNGPTATPCGVCTSCVEITAGTSPDLIEIDGASNNSVDDVRELRETVRYAPSHGRSKIYLVDEVHMLSNAAFNALLKTLEEPPAHVVFIFATTEPTKIPDTILSRVQRFDFKRIPATGVVERLAEIAAQEGARISPTGLRLIAHAGEGSMRDAQSLLDKVISFGGTDIDDAMVVETLGLIDRGLLYGMLGGLVRGEPERCLDVIARVYAFGHELSRFSSELLELVRHATFVRLSAEARRHVDLPDEELAQLEQIVADTDVDALTRLFAALLETHEEVSRAARPRIVLEMAVARLATIQPLVPVARLVARLEALERRLRQSDGARGGVGGGGNASERRTGPSKAHRTPAPRPQQRARSPRRGRTATAALGSDPSDDDRWAALQADLLALDPPASTLAGGTPARVADKLVVTVDAGRPLAAARREAEQPDVRRLVRAGYGDDVVIVPEPSLASRMTGISPELAAEAKADAGLQRALHILGGHLDALVPADPSDTGESP
ncbi:MAG: DNA polymerase III subunit gamma/tau [Alphaproteobacteria bacterium]|nr:DNA polymerase III subunit gamma/tau [Alphaproteobacteria bacterium]